MTKNIVASVRRSKKLLELASVVALLVLVGGDGVIASAEPAGKLLPKAQADFAVQQTLAAARAHPRQKPGEGGRPAPQPRPARRAGIIEMRQGPFPATEFAVRNVWQGPIGSAWLLVYAGAKRGPGGGADQAAVRVYSETPDLHMTLVGTFPVANQVGSVRIAGANGHRIELQTDNGSRVAFDLLTQQFE
jgi:hypothetical protein